MYVPKILPEKDSQTIDDLKAIGFDCKNIVEVNRPCFSFNKDTLEIIDSCENVPEGFESFPVITRRIFPDAEVTKGLLEWYNSQKLIAWYPCRQSGGDIAHHVRLRVLM